MRVSILVFLDQALKATELTGGGSYAASFNPCFPGSSAESLDAFAGIGILSKGFNPCFPGSSAESGAGEGWDYISSSVSILVFLDQALKVDAEKMSAELTASFNPCFPGSSAERRPAEGGND